MDFACFVARLRLFHAATPQKDDAFSAVKSRTEALWGAMRRFFNSFFASSPLPSREGRGAGKFFPSPCGRGPERGCASNVNGYYLVYRSVDTYVLFPASGNCLKVAPQVLARQAVAPRRNFLRGVPDSAWRRRPRRNVALTPCAAIRWEFRSPATRGGGGAAALLKAPLAFRERGRG